MYTNIWLKYLPIIRIVMKRAIVSQQTLALNVSDFERAGMKRKSGYKFTFGLKEGKVKNVIIDLPLATDLVSVLLQDKVIKDLVQTHEFQLSLSPKYELVISHIPQTDPVAAGEN